MENIYELNITRNTLINSYAKDGQIIYSASPGVRDHYDLQNSNKQTINHIYDLNSSFKILNAMSVQSHNNSYSNCYLTYDGLSFQ